MNVLALTIFVGFVLVGFFLLLFVMQISAGQAMSERDALLPLENDALPTDINGDANMRTVSMEHGKV